MLEMGICSLRSAKPTSLEDAINLAAELELIRGLEKSCLAPDAKELLRSPSEMSELTHC